MPEGDTIWRTAAAMRRRIGGKMVGDARPQAIARLKGRRLESVEPNGKHLIMRFEGGAGSPFAYADDRLVAPLSAG